MKSIYNFKNKKTIIDYLGLDYNNLDHTSFKIVGKVLKEVIELAKLNKCDYALPLNMEEFIEDPKIIPLYFIDDFVIFKMR
jgi:hypothetical protein